MIDFLKGEKVENSKKIIRPILWAIFATYAFLVIYLCFFSRRPDETRTIVEYFNEKSNFVPFKTILNYIKLSFEGYVTLAWANVFGNFILLLPLGMLIPCLIRRIDCFREIILLSFLTIIGIEGLQCVFRVGVIDIDDLILNLSGSALGYGLVNVPIIYRALYEIGAIEDGGGKNEKSRKK